ncbi:uncharacterized protein H6S33_002135 [Morchella sextelata]|uniref:uncharacterized protein n=1 Tax=Morchella sextelata TaxID=1174677 RepID=UPI001D058874|nr:uncharacterized protein H6S33_002135 [Morchella sextelata]KAH0608083.1 hypothetical protein H6S33_002135 [Morchella sextelata]
MANPTFFNQPPSTWNIIDYLNQHDPTSPSYNQQHTLDKWIKALVAISSDAKSTPEQRDKAQLLKDKYRQVVGVITCFLPLLIQICMHRQCRDTDELLARLLFKARMNCSLIRYKLLRASAVFPRATRNLLGSWSQRPARSLAARAGAPPDPDDLLGRSGRDSDRIRAREWLAGLQPSKKKKQNAGSSVNIYKAPVMNIAQGTFENSVVGSTINQSGKRKASDDLDASDCLGDDESLDEDIVRADQDEQGEGTPAAAAAQPLQANDDPPYKEFVAAYKAMTDESKFVFSETGRVLEDVMFENASVLTEKHTAHLWVVDLDHPVVTSWFQPKELEELRNQMLPMPELDEPFLASMARFSHADTTEEFRRIVEEVPYRPKGEPYDRSMHFDAAWVNIVILSMLSILESPNNLLHYPNLREGWYDCNPWSFLIDQCLLGLNGVLVQRQLPPPFSLPLLLHPLTPNSKEILCLALKLASPLPTRRFDAIIHTLAESPVLEYGAIEVAKSFESVHARKWSSDSSKLALALHAMLARLRGAVENDAEAVRRLQVVGLMNAGLRMQVVRMGVVGKGGNVAVLQRGRVKALPTEVGALRGVFAVMISVVMFKRMIQDCVEVVKGYNGLSGAGAGKTREEFLEELGRQNEL